MENILASTQSKHLSFVLIEKNIEGFYADVPPALRFYATAPKTLSVDFGAGAADIDMFRGNFSIKDNLTRRY